jgi:hypothetical protein
MKKVVVAEFPDCDVCKMEFPSSTPNKAKYDGPVAGTMWGYMCSAHKRNVPGLTTMLVLAGPVRRKLVD